MIPSGLVDLECMAKDYIEDLRSGCRRPYDGRVDSDSETSEDEDEYSDFDE